jgi:hypothetical protein
MRLKANSLESLSGSLPNDRILSVLGRNLRFRTIENKKSLLNSLDQGILRH